MTVGELIDRLGDFPRDMKVVYPITQKYCDVNLLDVNRDIEYITSGQPPWPSREVGDPFLVLHESEWMR
jgi:hypothetical protein